MGTKIKLIKCSGCGHEGKFARLDMSSSGGHTSIIGTDIGRKSVGAVSLQVCPICGSVFCENLMELNN